tara:strand:- start:2769 stop:4058 length:1290 start_codon:yes stop_codon:yes gene_type:complete
MKSKSKTYITSFNFIIAGLVLLLYGSIRFKKLFFGNFANGDEYGFLNIFDIYLDKGYSEALSQGSSITFNATASFFNLFFSNTFLSLRFTSFFFGVLTLLMVLKIQKTFFPLTKNYFLLLIITISNILIVSSVIFVGINDTILYFLATVFVFLVLNYQRDIKTFKFSLYLGLLFGIMLLTRKITIFYLPSIVIILIMLYKNLKIKTPLIFKSLSIVIVFSTITVILFNLPNLTTGKGISFHEKKLDNEISWSQLQYLTAIKHSNGEVKYGQHVSVDEVKQYITKNGEKSLPGKSFVNTIYYDIPFTIKDFFYDLFSQIKPITRLSGLIIVFFILILSVVKKISIYHRYLIVFFFTFVSTLCFIIISYVEPRWYLGALMLVLVPVYNILQDLSNNKNKRDKLNFIFINVQLLFIVTINLPYIISNYKLLL